MTEAEGAPLFGVERSIRGRTWRLATADEGASAALVRRFGLPEVAARAMAARGIGEDDARSYLEPTLRALMPDPLTLCDMDRAVDRLARAVLSREPVAVFGDYDVDGATSAALLVRYLRGLGVAVSVRIPDRLTEGYGPNAAAVRELARSARLLVTVDCGVTAFEALSAAREAGMEAVVLDHHQAEGDLPSALAVVDPKRPGDASGMDNLAAVGVVFLLLAGLNRALRGAGAFSSGHSEPDLLRLLDLVAFGTVCDVVPLVGLNRAFVAQGLKVLAARGNLGLATLADTAGITGPLSAYHIGFVLGPRINAGGRVGTSDLGVRLLTCDDPAEAATLAEELERHNGERREIEAATLLAAIEQVESTMPPDSAVAVAAGEDWHPGVVGLVAARLKERFNVPACAVTFQGGRGKGSGRSVPGVNLGAAILAAREAGILLSGGGHAMAAGFTLTRDRLSDFCTFLSDQVRAQIHGTTPAADLILDAALDVVGANAALVASLTRMQPFGPGNEEPRFAVPSVRLGRVDVVGAGHVRGHAYGSGGGRLKIIAFRAADDDLGQALLTHRDRPIHLAGTLRADTWQGRTDVQLVLEDAAWAE